MSFAQFISTLYETGSTSVPNAPDISEPDRASALALLRPLESSIRADMPGAPPRVDMSIALWAAELLYHACRFVAHRELEAQEMAAVLAVPCPGGMTPRAHYSVDLTLQYLPDVHRLAGAASQTDPLLKELCRIGTQWPLSSVGMPNLQVDPFSLMSHPSLAILYLDRILARGDRERAQHPMVLELLRTHVGIYPHLAGPFEELLEASVTMEPQ